MGKRYQLTTRMLRDDYVLTAIALRNYANLIERNSEVFSKILPDTPVNVAVERNQKSKIRIARMLAKRFQTRADRMCIDETVTSSMISFKNTLLNRFRI